MYAKVIIEIGVKNVDKMFTYIVPDNMKEDIKVGCRVKVRFGSMVLEGFVLELTNTIDKIDYELKEIIELVDKIPILNKEMLELGKKIQEITLCSLISAYQVMLPKALKASIKTNINTKLIRYAVSNRKDMELITYIENTKYEKQREFLKKLIVEKKIRIDKLESYLNTLEKNGLIKFIYEEDYRYKFNTNNSDNRVILNNEQEVCVNVRYYCKYFWI